MDPEILRQLVPIISVIAVFGMPLGIVFVTRHFKYKHRELEAELEARKLLSERDRVELEKRIERLESVVMGAAAARPPDANARFGNVVGPSQERASLYEGPATGASVQAVPSAPVREKG